MILPTTRWYAVAAGLAVLAPLALRWPAAASVLFIGGPALGARAS